jgi:hypothetical protein
MLCPSNAAVSIVFHFWTPRHCQSKKIITRTLEIPLQFNGVQAQLYLCTKRLLHIKTDEGKNIESQAIVIVISSIPPTIYDILNG